MVATLTVKPLDKSVMDDIGMTWHTDQDGSDYIVNELVEVREEEAEAYYAAANTLYDMYIEAAQHAIDNKLYYELGIPSNLVKLIEDSWEKDDWHLYGRFDLAGGLDGRPIKLVEFNADTPTSLFETSIIQWAVLKANGMEEFRQFNNLHQMLQQNFRRLIIGDDAAADFSQGYRGEKLLFSSVGGGIAEDERTVRYLQSVAHDAGFYTDFCYLDEAGFLEREGTTNKDGPLADYWFKLYPWEEIATEELELTRILEGIAEHGATRFINPAYTLLFQSKALMKVLCDLFPDSPYLLKTDFTALPATSQVRKKVFGREGANMAIFDGQGRVTEQTDGPYQQNKDVYQEFVAYPTDDQGRRYQAGVFYAWEACGLGFRRGGAILDNTSKFVGHIIV